MDGGDNGTAKFECSVSVLEEHRTLTPTTPTRRFGVLASISLFVICLTFQRILPSPNPPVSNANVKESDNQMTSVTIRSPNSTLRPASESIDTMSTTSTPTSHSSFVDDDTSSFSTHTCKVPYSKEDKYPELASKTAATVFAHCSSHMGKHITKHQRKQVAHLPKNKNAHVFSFPRKKKNTSGQRPLLCVPQKNGNKQFGGLVFAAWNKKAAETGEGVDHDMKHWQYHDLPSRIGRKGHVYLVARYPYSRILSLYLQKVVSDCISDGQKGCDKPGWHSISSRTSFKEYVEIIEQKVVEHGSLCAVSHHLCQQVESCITTTKSAQEITAIRLEEQSCWFPCLIKELGMKSTLLREGWEQFSGQSCYYSATGECQDMLRSIDPSKVEFATGNVHATGASNRLHEHYDEKTAEIVSRLYAVDFEILGYPLWDGVSDL